MLYPTNIVLILFEKNKNHFVFKLTTILYVIALLYKSKKYQENINEWRWAVPYCTLV